MPIKDLLVVVSTEHWQQCKFLLDSIDYYLNGYKITVVDNSPQWANLSHTMANNHIRILPWQDFIPTRIVDVTEHGEFDRGWISQQLIKLSAHKLFKDDYVCLGTSNVILQSFENSAWPLNRYPLVPNSSHAFYKFYLAVKRKFGLKKPLILHPQTPYILNTSQVASMLSSWNSWAEFSDWFTSFKNPSEFWLYDIWLQKQGKSQHVDHYIEVPLLCFYTIDQWTQFQNSNRDISSYTVAQITQMVWEDPTFASVIHTKGLNFLKP